MRRVEVEVACIDFSVLCESDGTVYTVQVFDRRIWDKAGFKDLYKDVDWLISEKGMEAIQDAVTDVLNEVTE
jgi:hypothetical protein